MVSCVIEVYLSLLVMYTSVSIDLVYIRFGTLVTDSDGNLEVRGGIKVKLIQYYEKHGLGLQQNR